MTALWSNRRGGENPNGRGGPLPADAHPAAPKADKEGRQQAGTAILLRVQIISWCISWCTEGPGTGYAQ